MKKFLAMLLASTMVLSLSVTAFAANEATADAESENKATIDVTADADSENKATIDVTGKYEKDYINADTVISVDVAWDSMEFTYAAGGYEGEWNPGDHSYKNGNSGDWVKKTSDITITNHSNSAVTATFTFTKADAFTDGEVAFKQNDSAVTAVDLATAVGTEKENAPKQTVTFAITAGSITADGKLGTITVAISEKEAAETPSVASVIDATSMSADDLKTELAAALKAGKTDLNITLAANADKAMTTAIFEAITGSGAADGSLSLTLKGITDIGDSAFYKASSDPRVDNGVYMKQVGTLTLTDVKTIGEAAFCQCSYLTTLTAPKLETVGGSAFNCCDLSVIDLPALTTMEPMAFAFIKNIEEINLPSLEEISVFAFNSCTFVDDAQIILTGLNAEGTFNDYWDDSTYTHFFSDDSTSNVNLKLSSALADQVSENTWTAPRKSGASSCTTYTFKSITLVDNNAE